MEDRNAFL